METTSLGPTLTIIVTRRAGRAVVRVMNDRPVLAKTMHCPIIEGVDSSMSSSRPIHMSPDHQIKLGSEHEIKANQQQNDANHEGPLAN